ncbi:MAG: hypothetical protein IPI43_27095 [Sandaracinaceae bacterium]|nr:hypothetical protein [Sandaracinaceae bacterium]
MPLTTLHALLLDASDAGLARLAAAHGSGPEVRTAWAQLRGDVSLASAAIAAIERSGALTEPLEPRPRMLVEDLLSLLGKVSHGHDLLLRAWREAPQHEVRQRAGLALLARSEARGLEALAARLDEATGNERVLALQAVFTRDPGEAHAVLSPRFTPPSPRAAGFVYDSLHVLMRDIHDDGRAHWERPAAGSRRTRAGWRCAKHGPSSPTTAQRGASERRKASSRWLGGCASASDAGWVGRSRLREPLSTSRSTRRSPTLGPPALPRRRAAPTRPTTSS